MNEQALRFSVSDFIAVVNQTFDYAYSSVEVVGEVSSFKVNQNKYVFFDLRDESGVVNCFMTVWQLRVPIQDGMKVIVVATPKLTDKGKFSLNVKSLRLSGEGSIKKSFDILKAKLDSEGLFDDNRKQTLPAEPVHIGLISSVQAAGYADFMQIINDRWGGLKIDVAHVQVQGDLAADQIISAIKYFNQLELQPEVITIVRGGGSAEDLAVFNDEKLVRAISLSSVPILVGIGHETDVSLCDLAADVSAITPTSAAQILVPDKNELNTTNRYRLNSILIRIDNILSLKYSELSSVKSGIIRGVDDLISDSYRILESSVDVLKNIDPSKVLLRGYAIIRGEISAGSIVTVETSDKEIEAEVKNVRQKNI